MNVKNLFLSLLALLLFSSFLFAQDLPYLEPAELETAFVYNFLKFVTWPDNEDNEFLFCVVGKTDLLPYLLDLDGQPLNGKTLKVKKVKLKKAQLIECKAIFVGKLKKSDREKLFAKIAQEPILTISDEPGFVEQGGIIELFLKQDRFRFKVNLSVARKVNLFISSRLLRLAEEVL